MKTIAAVIALAALAWWLHKWEQRRKFRDGPNYVTAILSWTPDTPLKLPPIRQLKAQKAPRRLRMLR